VDGLERKGGVPSRLLKTDAGGDRQEGPPRKMFAGSPSGRTTGRSRSRGMTSRGRARGGWESAQERWRRFNGHELVADVLDGVKFKDGIKVTQDDNHDDGTTLPPPPSERSLAALRSGSRVVGRSVVGDAGPGIERREETPPRVRAALEKNATGGLERRRNCKIQLIPSRLWLPQCGHVYR
jgi:hypothetical protein